MRVHTFRSSGATEIFGISLLLTYRSSGAMIIPLYFHFSECVTKICDPNLSEHSEWVFYTENKTDKNEASSPQHFRRHFKAPLCNYINVSINEILQVREGFGPSRMTSDGILNNDCCRLDGGGDDGGEVTFFFFSAKKKHTSASHAQPCTTAQQPNLVAKKTRLILSSFF